MRARGQKNATLRIGTKVMGRKSPKALWPWGLVLRRTELGPAQD